MSTEDRTNTPLSLDELRKLVQKFMDKHADAPSDVDTLIDGGNIEYLLSRLTPSERNELKKGIQYVPDTHD